MPLSPEDVIETQLLLCSPFIPCYSTKHKTWRKIAVTNLRDIAAQENTNIDIKDFRGGAVGATGI